MVDHAKIVERLAELRTTAEAAAPEWQNVGIATTGMPPFVAPTVVVEHAATWSPAAALRWLSWAEQVAAEHRLLQERISHDPADGPGDYPWVERCLAGCGPYPCGVLTGLAGALGLEET